MPIHNPSRYLIRSQSQIGRLLNYSAFWSNLQPQHRSKALNCRLMHLTKYFTFTERLHTGMFGSHRLTTRRIVKILPQLSQFSCVAAGQNAGGDAPACRLEHKRVEDVVVVQEEMEMQPQFLGQEHLCVLRDTVVRGCGVGCIRYLVAYHLVQCVYVLRIVAELGFALQFSLQYHSHQLDLSIPHYDCVYLLRYYHLLHSNIILLYILHTMYVYKIRQDYGLGSLARQRYMLHIPSAGWSCMYIMQYIPCTIMQHVLCIMHYYVLLCNILCTTIMLFSHYILLLYNFIMQSGMLDIKKIPKFQFQLHNQQLIQCIKQLHSQVKVQGIQLNKLRKDVDAHPSTTQLIDAFTLLSTVQIDTSLTKLISSTKPQQQLPSIHSSSIRFMNKLTDLSLCVKAVLGRVCALEKSSEAEQSKQRISLNEKSGALQAQCDELSKKLALDKRELSNKIDIATGEYTNKLKEVESKTLWQIGDCQNKLNDRVSTQMVKDSMSEVEGRIMTKIKAEEMKHYIDPGKIENLYCSINRVEKEVTAKIIQNSSKMNEISEHINISLLSKGEYGVEKIENEKRFGQIQGIIGEVSRRLQSVESQSKGNSDQFCKIRQHEEGIDKEISSMSKVLSNLKLSAEFQKLMESLDPHKLCEIDTSIHSLSSKQLFFQKELNLQKQYIEKIREKTQICNLLTPNGKESATNKEEVNKLVQDLIATHPQVKRIQTIEAQMYQYKAYGELINDINKRIARMQKETDIQGVIYSIKGLEQYVKKQMLTINNRLFIVESTINEMGKRRPSSAQKTGDTRITSSISFKKLIPVDCISCYTTKDRQFFRK